MDKEQAFYKSCFHAREKVVAEAAGVINLLTARRPAQKNKR